MSKKQIASLVQQQVKFQMTKAQEEKEEQKAALQDLEGLIQSVATRQKTKPLANASALLSPTRETQIDVGALNALMEKAKLGKKA